MKENEKFHTVRGYQLLEQNKKLLTSAMEDYLEMIYRISLEDEFVRINTLAELLNVQASSATKMVQKLSMLKLIDYKKYGIIKLTESGKIIGSFLLKRHNIVEAFFQYLGVTEHLLIETELIEHHISLGTLRKINILNIFLGNNNDIIKKLREFEKLYDKKNDGL